MLLLTEFYQTLQFLQGEFFLRKNSIGLYLLNTRKQKKNFYHLFKWLYWKKKKKKVEYCKAMFLLNHLCPGLEPDYNAILWTFMVITSKDPHMLCTYMAEIGFWNICFMVGVLCKWHTQDPSTSYPSKLWMQEETTA